MWAVVTGGAQKEGQVIIQDTTAPGLAWGQGGFVLGDWWPDTTGGQWWGTAALTLVQHWAVQSGHFLLTDPVLPGLLHKDLRYSIIKLTHSAFVEIYSEHLHSKTERARELRF